MFAAQTNPAAAPPSGKVYILPIREDIMPPLVYVVRRGVKEAMEANADALILDMNTDGGRVDVTEEIIEIISKFKGPTVTYVNDRAFSAGAFISVATQKIYMAPQSVIGAAAPIMMSPGGTGVEKMPDTVEAKMTSAVRALVRTQAEKNGHNIEVIEAMIDKTKELTIDGEVLNKEGNILTLTDRQAAKEYGNPPKPLLSSGTVESLDALLAQLGYAGAQRIEIKPTGAETAGHLDQRHRAAAADHRHRRALHRIQDAGLRPAGHRRDRRVCDLFSGRLRGGTFRGRLGDRLRGGIDFGAGWSCWSSRARSSPASPARS